MFEVQHVARAWSAHVRFPPPYGRSCLSGHDPIADISSGCQRVPMTAVFRITVVACVLCVTACSPPPPGKPVTDGCYYSASVPVLRIAGKTGTILVAGDVTQVNVTPDRNTEQAGVTFEPGFHIAAGPPMRVQRLNDLPRSSYMMKPYANQPTIMVGTEPLGLIDLVRGPAC